ncbi:integrase core domain-containing protein [bacterium]|nr:integrase core domain-containing protein [bacterium]
MIEAFPWSSAPKYLIRDNDKIYGYEFNKRLDSIGIKPVKTGFKSPYQNVYCERVIGTLLRDCTDHVIIFNENHLKRVLRQYIEGYYNVSRTHLSLEKDCPEPCDIETFEMGKIVEIPILGGLYHRYGRQAAA